MSKPRKMNLASLIAQEVAPQVSNDVLPEPAVTAEVVTLTQPKPEAVRPVQSQPAPKRAGEGTIKERTTQVTLYLERAVHDQLRELAFTERSKMHPLMLEALDLLFKKRGLKSLKDLAKASKA